MIFKDIKLGSCFNIDNKNTFMKIHNTDNQRNCIYIEGPNKGYRYYMDNHQEVHCPPQWKFSFTW